MKCVLVLLAAVLLFCSLYTCATSTTDIQKGSLAKLNMRSNNLHKLSYGIEETTATSGDVSVSCKVSRSVSCNAPSGGTATCTIPTAVANTNSVTCTVTGTVPSVGSGTSPITCSDTPNDSRDGAGTCTVTGTSAFTNPTVKDNNINVPVTVTLAGPLTVTGSDKGVSSVTGQVTGSISGTVTGTGTVDVTVSGTLKGSGTVKTTAGDAASNSGPKDKDATPDPAVPVVKSADSPDTTTTTTTDAPATTTTSTAAPKEGPQQSTEKPDSSYGHSALYVSLFFGIFFFHLSDKEI